MHYPKRILIFVDSDYEDTPYDQWLKGLDMEVHLLVSEEKYDGYRHLARAKMVTDYRTNPNLEIDALRILRERSFDAVFARAEIDVLRCARLRELAGIRGQHWDSAFAYRNKPAMKACLRHANIATPEFALIHLAVDVQAFVEEHGYPVVIKPIDSSGSVNTWVIRNECEVQAFYDHGMGPRMEIETFVEGQMYHIDGLIHNFAPVFTCPSTYVNDCLAWKRNDPVGSYLLMSDHPLRTRLTDFTHEIIKGMPPVQTSAFHAEIFHTTNDQFVVCEIASRSPGGLIVQSIEMATGVNLDREWLRAVCEEPVSFPERLKQELTSSTAGFVLLPPKEGVLQRFPEMLPPYEPAYSKINGEVGEHFSGSTKVGHYLAGYVMKADSETAIQQRIAAMADWFEGNCTWEKGIEKGHSMPSHYGLTRVVNAMGKVTTLGASRSLPAVIEKVQEGAHYPVSIVDLEEIFSQIVARVTRAEAACLTACTAASITLAVAACMTRDTEEAYRQLPCVHGLPSTILMQAPHCVNYGAPIEQAVALSGGRVCIVGEEQRATETDLDRALQQEDIAALILVESHLTGSAETIPLARSVALAQGYGVPVIVDGAGQDLRLQEMIASGAELILVSCQKYLRSLTAGAVLGRRSFVDGVRRQVHGIGRGMKASKEATWAAIAAFEYREKEDLAAWARGEAEKSALIGDYFTDYPGIGVIFQPDPQGNPFSRILITLDSSITDCSAEFVADHLEKTVPSYRVRRGMLDENTLEIDPVEMTPLETVALCHRIDAIIKTYCTES